MMNDKERWELKYHLGALGVCKTEEEAERLTVIADKFDISMEQLVLMLANRCEGRARHAIKKLDKFHDYKARFQAEGMDLDEAFKKAFILQAEYTLQHDYKFLLLEGKIDELGAELIRYTGRCSEEYFRLWEDAAKLLKEIKDER